MRVFRESCGEAASPDCGVLRAMETVFGQRRAPRLVLRLTAHGGFNVITEWCVANGVPVRDFTAYANAREADAGAALSGWAAPARLSDLVRPPRPPGQYQGAVASWAASGWEALTAMLEEMGDLEPARVPAVVVA